MTHRTLADFLLPEGFAPPTPAAILREGSVVREAGHYLLHARDLRRQRRLTPYAGATPPRTGDPVLLVPGFMAGDGTLSLMARSLRAHGFRTYRSHIHANIGCTLSAAAQLEERLEHIAWQRGSRVRIVGHSLGGMLARGVAAKRPDLVSGIVTMGSPTLAPGAHHPSLTRTVEMLVRLSRAGMQGLMAEDCVAGGCARESFERARAPWPDDVDFTAIYSKRDGIVDWRACVDPDGIPVEVRASHAGMALDPIVIGEVTRALRHVPAGAAAAGVRSVEVDAGEIA
ncbi:MAG: alpha/beta hydrolase [Nocardioides sp.]|nr:alpha/beta hydrolase [Nocardioides sp.]